MITPESIILGDNVFIGWRARIEGVKQYQSKKFTPKVTLNSGVSIQQNLHLTCAESIEIGRNTAIAANVSITDIHHPYDDINIPIEHQNIKTNPVFIGDDCKIYNNSVILPGTKIGKHCTIGANSVVSGQFADYCVIVGSPAKIIKRYSFEKQAWLKTDAKGNFTEI
ncbi:acyltransferase [Chryseobacterium sp. T16E-39]|uniref:acyltransferase n=1 Tax=Chryseobacterium sp. T16E-39 TaxID=2015076 RepID=UPI00155FEBC7|nr:acyltransferase [Chryseobacterium sp. T16E-39]